MRMTSPREKLPVTLLMPFGNRELPRSRMAAVAPSSTVISPAGGAPKIQRLRFSSGVAWAWNSVPTEMPSITSPITAQQKTRLAFAGLKYKDLGSFDYGRNLGALYDVEAWTDMFPEFGGDSSAQTDNFMTKRASGLATYRNTDFFGVIDGLNLTLQYQGKNENRDVKKQNGDGFGTSLTYDFGGSDFAISGAYTNSDRTNEQNLQSRGTGKRAEAWATGLKYDANNIYLATFYSETRKMTPITGGFANKTQNFEAVAQYQFDFGLRPSLGYVLSKGKDIEGIGDEDLVNYIDVGATYYFNKNMSAFVDYKINQLDSDNKLNINNDDIVAVGMTYQF